MSKLSANIVKFNKQKSIPAMVIDVVGRTCTVILSGRGKVLHGISFIGPSPTVGDSVIVNYISGKPVVEAGTQAVTTPVSSTAPRPSSQVEAQSPYHNDMKGLQGGAEAGLSSNAEYFHLTQEELDKLNGPTRLPAADAAGTVDAITADFDPNITLEDQLVVSIVATGANVTSTPSFTPDGLTTYLIVKRGGHPLEPGDIPGENAVCLLEYNATYTRWELLNPALGNVVDGGDTPVGGTPPTILLHFDGDDESQDFIDEAGNTWAVTGTTKIDTGQAKFGPGACMGGGEDDYISATVGALGTGDFTWECWVYITGYEAMWYNNICCTSTGDSGTQLGFLVGVNGKLKCRYYVYEGVEYDTVIGTNGWHHVALVRQSGTFYAYVDGVKEATSWTSSRNLAYTSRFICGCDPPAGHAFFNGYMDEFAEWTFAKYTTNFTPSTEPHGYAGTTERESTIRFRRGTEAQHPSLYEGEPYLETDTSKLFVGPLEFSSDGVIDAEDIAFTPETAADWDGSADPGDVDDALDQLAERVDDLENAEPPASDAADITFTPTTVADWDSDTDPGNADGALDQLAERVTDIEEAGGSPHNILSATHEDTDTTAPNDGDVLTWDEVAGQWKAAAPTGGGGGGGVPNVFIDQSGGTSDTYGVLAGDRDGNNTQYTVSESEYVTGSLKVYLNGQLQTQGTGEDWVETTPGSGTFDFNTAPEATDEITVSYLVASTAIDSDDVTYAPTTVADWSGGADPGDVEQALDQLAERTKDLEDAGTSILEIQVFM